MPRATYDSPWKNILNQFLQPFLEFCLTDVAEQIDWSRPYVCLDKELQAITRKQKVTNRVADALFQVWLKNGKEVWLLLHIEVQGKPEMRFCERMYIYNYRIFDRYKKPIISLAILADANPNWHPKHYERSSPHNYLRFEFATVKLLDYADQKQALSRDSNPFAIVVWAHLEALQTSKHPEQRLKSKLAITRAFYKHGFKKSYILGLYSFIDWILALPEPLELEYIETVEQLEEEKHVRYITSAERIGMQKGMQQGMRDGERIILLRQLHYRFGPLPDQYETLIAKAEDDELLLWSERLLDAKTLKDIFGV